MRLLFGGSAIFAVLSFFIKKRFPILPEMTPELQQGIADALEEWLAKSLKKVGQVRSNPPRLSVRFTCLHRRRAVLCAAGRGAGRCSVPTLTASGYPQAFEECCALTDS